MNYKKWNNFLSIDIGYGDVKINLIKENGSQLLEKFPSAVAPVSPKSYGNGEVVKFEGQHYLVGEAALKYKPIEMNDYETLEKYAPLLLFRAFELYGDYDTIVTGLSIRQEKNSENFKQRLSNFIINGYEYNVTVYLLPQGIGAKLVVEKENEDLQDYLICDGGFNTVDLVPVFGGKAEVHAVDALENRGIIEVINVLIDHISTEFNIELSPKEAKEVLDTGSIKIYGETKDLSSIMNEISFNYSKDLVKQIERKFKSSWHKFEKIIVVGGLSYFINENVYEHLVSVKNGEYWNVIGFNKFAENNLEKTPATDKKPKKRINRTSSL